MSTALVGLLILHVVSDEHCGDGRKGSGRGILKFIPKLSVIWSIYRHVMGQIHPSGRKVDYASIKDGAAGAQTSYFARKPSECFLREAVPVYLNHKENIFK